jgi:hypothetical protein
MTIDESRVIVTSGDCLCHSVHTTQTYHRDFPEIRAEDQSALKAAAYLIRLLNRSLNSASGPWQSEGIEQAIADVQSFIDSGGRIRSGDCQAVGH